MKFLCDNCKAKYQIGDDKVAGKTVRMKCRRCGFDIHVNASTIVEETSAAPWPDASATMQGSMAIVTPELAASLSLHPEAVPAAPAAPRPVGAPSVPKPAIPRAIPAPRPIAPAPAPAPQAAAPKAKWHAESGEPDDESTAIMTIPLRVAVAATQAAASSSSPATPTPTAAASSARPIATTPRPAPAATPRPAVAAPRPGVPRAPGAQPGPASPATSASKPAPGGVAGAFARAAIAPEPAAPSVPQDGWYVGIAGAPFGPASLDAIREKCRAGDIHADSLVWRDGQGEWKPLRTFAGLFSVFNAVNGDDAVNADNIGNGNNVVNDDNVGNAGSDSSLNAARVASLASNVPAATPTPAPYATSSTSSTPPVSEPLAAAPAPEPAPSPEPPYAVSAFASPTGRGSAATAILSDVFPDQAGNPFAAPQPPINGAANGASHGATPMLGALADPFAPPAPNAPPPAAAAPVPAPTTRAPSSQDSAASGFASGTGSVPIEIDESVVPKRRNPPHPMAYAFIAFAAVFGGVAAYVLLSKPQPIVVVQAAPSAAVTAVQPSSDKPEASAAVAVGELTTDATGAAVVRPGVPGTGGPKPKASATAGAAPIDTSGFTSTIPGPSTAQAPSPTGAGGQLSAGEIQGVVAQNQSIVKRKCWQPALESRAANAPSNARVNGTITIGASGNVESASASGGERDFPGLSSCIASRMKNWKFPPSSGSTPVNVPFVFAGQ